MTIAELFSYLHSLDVQLWADGDRLRVNAPKGVLTPELSAELAERKAELLAFLKRAQGAAETTVPPMQPVSRDQELPLSFAQQRIWFLDQLEPGNPAYILTGALRLQGVLDTGALERGVTTLVARHETLRTTFALSHGEPVQRVLPPAPVSIPVVDLRETPAAAREEQANRLIKQAIQTPFDLATGPLFGITLFRLDTDAYIMLLRIHHIISDGVSIEIFLRELAMAYDAERQGQSLALPALPIQYADFAHWQRHGQGAAFEHQLAYWKQQLAGSLPVLELPLDFARPTVQTFRGAKLPWQLPVSLCQTIKTLSRKEDVTVFMFLLAAFKLLLYRYTGQTDILVGTPISGRIQVETEGVIGCFLNNLALRTDLGGNPSFSELLKRVRDVAAAAYTHQDIPFEKLVEELHPDRDISRSPLFQAMFLQLNALSVSRLADLNATMTLIDNGSAIMDLSMYVQEQGDRLAGILEYNTDLFAEATMRRFLDHYQVLLEGIVADPGRPIAALPILTDAERQQMLVSWNATAADYPKERCLHQLFEQQAQRTPDATAVVFEGDSLSYRDLNRRADYLACHLQRLGVGPGALVAICMERSLELPVALLGILKAGGAYLPLDPAYPKERLAFMLEDAQASVLLTQQPLRADLPQSAAHVSCLDTDWPLIAAEEGEPVARVRPEHLAYVIYTSGSTGKPKGVQLTHRSVVNFMTAMQQRPGLDARDTLLAVTTLSFDIAALELFLPLLVGAKVVIASREVAADGDRLARLLAESQATVMQATPVTWRLLLAAGWPGDRRLKVLCGGEALPRDLADRLLERCGSLWNMYGPTETTIWSTLEQVTPGSGPVSIGRPIANTQVYVLDARLQPVPVGVTGDLYIAGDGLAAGYLNRPELTAERFVLNPFTPDSKEAPITQLAARPDAFMYKTGDLARYLPDGRIDFLGRADHQVKLRGHRIELGEIEALLAQHPGVRQAVVVVREDEPGQQRLVAYYVPAEEMSPALEELRRSLKEQLPDYMVPTAFVPLERFPLTPNNKVDRRALPAPDSARPELETRFVAPQTELEQVIAEVWKEVLTLDQVGVEDNFFDLGGHSLLLAQVHSRLKQRLGVSLTIVKLFQYPTITALAGYLAEQAAPSGKKRPLRRAGAVPAAVPGEAVAIVGMAGRFPGAKDIDEFWANLRDGVESIRFFSDDELAAAGVPPELLANPHYVKAKAALDDSDLFDATFFGINPREAEVTDPQHRLFLECAWEALEAAGYDPAGYAGAIGVFAGASINSYLLANLLPGLGQLDSAGNYQLFVGNDKDFLPTRVSYKLNLRGPSVSIQTACSTSLVAVHQACRSLLSHECDMALAGGVSVGFPQKTGYLYQEGMILSPDGHCRAFDAQAKGTVSGEGVGIVVLKRLSDALAGGDTVYAVIRGSAINNDGADKVGYTAPGVDGQAEVIRMAQAAAGVAPDQIDYVEAHGTGTPLGDPVEIAALTQVFGDGAGRERPCAIGSVKTNIGHLDAAAGVAGLIKTVLALHHKQLPPSLHFSAANPEIDFAHSPFRVNAQLAEWPANGGPRRAGVSSFGIGGTNAHVVLEEAPPVEAAPPRRTWQVLPLSAKTRPALDAATAHLREHLRRHPELALADVAHTLQMGRRAFDQRRVVVCRSTVEAITALETLEPAQVFTQVAMGKPGVVFMFPGQGAQYVGMGRGLYAGEPVFRDEVDRCAEQLMPWLGFDLRDVLFAAEDDTDAADRLRQTQVAQPALFVIGYALAKLWMSWGVRPAALIGHSIGEYVAACLAGVFSLEDALRLVTARGRLMQALPRGEMLAVALPEQDVRGLLNGDGVALAAVNAPSLCVVSGPVEAIHALRDDLAARDVESRPLHTSHAFHSPMMAAMAVPFAAELAQVELHAPQLPVVSNVTGEWLRAGQATDPGYWVDHALRPVRFAEGLGTVLAEPGVLLLEVGPGNSLGQLARQHQAKPAGSAIFSSLRHPRASQPDELMALSTLGRLWCAGVPVDWQALHMGEQRRRVRLPAYPFERQRYLVQPRPDRHAAAQLQARSHKQADMAGWFYLPAWQRVPVLRSRPALEQPLTWLIFLDRVGVGADLAGRLAAQGQTVLTVTAGKGYAQTDGRSFRLAPDRPEDYAALVETLTQAGLMPDRIVHLWSVTPERRRGPVQWEEAAQTAGFYSLLYLAQALNRQELDKPVELLVVASGLYDVRGDEALDPAKATLVGISRVIPQEIAGVRCRTLDVTRAADKPAAQRLGEQLLTEVMLPAGEPDVALRGAQRWVQSYAPVPLPAPAPDAAAFRSQGVYLITGGLGGIGQALAGYLAQHFQARLVLTARSTLPGRDQWEAWLADHPEDDATSRRIRAVQALEEMGAEVLVAAADVADARQMQAVIAQSYARFGALHGVIHAAGTVAGARLAELDRDQCEQQFHAKGRGLAVLAQVLAASKAVQAQPPDFCLVTSSLSTVLGGLGYAAYAAANAYMDAFVHHANRDGRGLWSAVDWDAWSFAPAPSGGHLSGLAGLAMTLAEGVETLARILAAAPGSQVVVSTGDLEARLDQWVRMKGAAAEPTTAQAVYAARGDRQEYVAPRNAVEEVLAAIWGNLLGIQEVGIHDSFFDLGGSSLVAVRLFDQIERRLGAKLPLATLFEASTVAQQAELLGDVDLPVRPAPKVAKGWSPLVAIQPHGTRPPLYCVHAAGGNVLIYRDLARHLGQDQPVYGLQAQGLDGKQPVLERVEEMAELYVREIQAVQPHGPYLLGGYCMGGTVALEMAQRLNAAGEQVAFLALFETYNWCAMQLDAPGAGLLFMVQKLEFHLRNFMQLNREGKRIFLGEKIKVAQSRKQVFKGMILKRLGRLQGRYGVADLLPAKVWEVNDLAALYYQPRAYAGKITHFRPAKEYRIHMGPDLDWEQWAAEVETHRVAAYPAGMMVEPFVAGLAERVCDCIDRALDGRRGEAAASKPEPAITA